MSFWTMLTGGASRWDADTPKPDRAQAARDLAGVRSSSRPNHEAKKDREDARKDARRAKRAGKPKKPFFY